MLNIIKKSFNTPVLLKPEYAETFYAYLSSRVGMDEFTTLSGEVLSGDDIQAFAGEYDRDRESKPYQVVDGIAIVPIEGTLVHRFGYMRPVSGMTGYDGIQAMIRRAESDPDVKGIFFDIDSPGGMVHGCFDTADLIREAEKPTYAYIDEQCCSAAYALASGADTISLPRTGEAGSIGVVWAHTNIEKKLEQEGRQVTLFFSGKHKVDGNPYQPIPDDVKTSIQRELDDIRSLFADTVAKGRDLDVIKVLATEASTYAGEAAVKAGLCDAVFTKDEAFNQFLSLVDSGVNRSSVRATTMSTKKMSEEATVEKDNPLQMISLEDHQNQVNAAVQSERERFAGIVQSEQAEGRMATAITLAEQGMDVDAALAVLATIPAQVSAQAETDKGEDANVLALRAMASAAQIEEPEQSANNVPAQPPMIP